MAAGKRTSIGPTIIRNLRENLIDNDQENSQKPKEAIDSKDLLESSFKPWQVFINHIDSYHGKKLVDNLSDRPYVNPQSEDQMDEEEIEEEEEEVVEEEEEEEEEETEVPFHVAKDRTGKTLNQYEIIGTTLDPEYPRPENVTIIRNPADRDDLLAKLINCGIVIYDITDDPDQIDEVLWVLKGIVRELELMKLRTPKAFKRSNEVRYFVLISTLMTWANTKPLSSDEPDLPFTEDYYRKRKPHPNFKKHVQCEKEVTVVYKSEFKDKLKTLVICCGATYGDEQGPLHHLFKMAWQNAPFLPILGDGYNKIPLLHVRDLISVIIEMLQRWPSVRYIIAAETEPVSQRVIVKKISEALSTGKVKQITKEEAFLLPEITQRIYDLMTMNLVVDPEYIADRISWHYETPFRNNMNAIVKEYRAARVLHPVKIIVLGPPAAGKTRVAQYLCKHYDIHYVHVKSMIEETIEKLKKEIEELDEAKEAGMGDVEEEDNDDLEDEEEEEEATNIEMLEQLLEEIENNMERNKGRIDDGLLNRLFLRKLRSKECQNQGFVLDGYPKTLEQVRELFAGMNPNDAMEEEMEEEEETNQTTGYTIMPELIVSLEASDDFLKERIIQRPEREIQGTHYTERHMIRRLKEYRKRNTDENTPLQFFDEIEIHPLIIDIENDVCPDMFPTAYECIEKVGPPRNYGLTAQEARDALKRDEKERHAAEVAAKLQKEKELMELKKYREEKMAEWTSLMEKLKEEEEEKICILGLPLRHYLMKYVLPTLTQGLIEVANLRPDDPVDFLAEYLFKENPEGKMFEPDYTAAMNSMLDTIEQFQDQILPSDQLSKKLASFLKQRSKESVETSGSTVSDVCTSKKTAICVTPSFTYDDSDTYEKEEETTSDKTDYCKYVPRECL